MDFTELGNEFFHLYDQKDYLAAFELASAFVPDSPGVQTTLTNWRLCAASLAGKPELVLDVFQKAIDRGFFYPAKLLRKDPDLAAMQGNPEYQHLVAICEQRHENASKNAQAQLSVTLPETPEKGPYPLLLGFHGWGQSLQDFGRHWQPMLAKGWLVALAQSSQVNSNDVFVWDDLERSLAEAVGHYQALDRQYAIDPGRIFLAGFSQGAGLAVWAAVSRKIPASGFLTVGPYVQSIDELSAKGEPVPGLRGYFVTGGKEQDGGMYAKIEALLTVRSIPFRRENYSDLGHEFPADFDQTLEKALQFLLSKE